MTNLRVNCFSISIDGFSAGPRQTLEDPLGTNGSLLHNWIIETKTFKQIFGSSGGTVGVDDDFAAAGFENIGSWILGRNMFGPPEGGDWEDDSWRGWWGNNPPYHCDVFVLTNYKRAALAMEGGTTFHFVTDGTEEALKLAKEAANGKDVRLGGGAQTIRQYLVAGLVDQIHLAVVPALLGSGENLFDELDLLALGYSVDSGIAGESAYHLNISRVA
jgi:dihydrofolate reductase